MYTPGTILRLAREERKLSITDVEQFAKLRVYGGADHPHTAQNPEKVDFKSKNSKNVKVA